jgi:hypothetical protein
MASPFRNGHLLPAETKESAEIPVQNGLEPRVGMPALLSLSDRLPLRRGAAALTPDDCHERVFSHENRNRG